LIQQKEGKAVLDIPENNPLILIYMIMKNISLGLIAIMIFTISSCKVTKKINKAIETKELTPVLINKDVEDSIRMVNETFGKFKSHNIDFQTFNAKIKVESDGTNGKNPDITAVVKIIKDSAIWMSLSATFLNVEIYRVLITKDSVILINKQKKEVQYRSLDYLQEVTQIPFDYKTLENLIIGNPIFIGDSVKSFRKIDNNILISTIDQYFKNLITISNENKVMMHSKMDDIDISRSRTADIMYEGYENNNGYYFSTDRQISISEKTKMDIKFNYKQYEFNKELSVNFNVPKNYQRK